MAAALPLCYHGAISKKECEELLGKKKKDGAYLIRASETIRGALCLCVYKARVVHTYRLLQTCTGQYAVMVSGGTQEVFFKTLDDLIHHYKRKNQGLVMHLQHPVKRRASLTHPLIPAASGGKTSERMSEEEAACSSVPESVYVEVLPE